MTATTTPLTEQTPVEIDTELARLSQEAYHAERQIEIALHSLHSAAGDRQSRQRGVYAWEMSDREAYEKAPQRQRDRLMDAQRRLDAVNQAMAPLHAEFVRRGGWTRAFLVQASNGHVHKDRACSTCFATTRYFWVTDLSGHNEAEIVEKAGERACTVCYPSAPVEVLSRPTQIFSDEERDQQKAREEREAKRAAKAAAEITVEGYYGYSDRPKTKVFKTVRAVTNDIASNLSSLCFYGVSHPDGPQWVADVEACRAALAAKGVEYDYDKALAAARKKVEKEMRSGMMADPTWVAQY